MTSPPLRPPLSRTCDMDPPPLTSTGKFPENDSCTRFPVLSARGTPKLTLGWTYLQLTLRR